MTAQIKTDQIKTEDKHLIIGAGFIGLGIAQALKAAKIAYDQVERSDRLGGNWYHGVYTTAHIISSRKITQFQDFPMPKDYPDFPSAAQMLSYLESFAEHYDLPSNIELEREVSLVNPITNNLWSVKFANGEQRIYKGIIMCNGHHWHQRFPKFSGSFDGEIIHSKEYKRPEQLRGKKVLVIGGGNSACDIAAEAGRIASKSVLSLRESVWFLPKAIAGIPFCDLIQWWMPEWFQKLFAYLVIRFTFGTHQSYGLEKPKHQIFAKHPTLNNEVPYYLQHGRIIPKPEVKFLDGNEVEFSDRTREKIDLIVCATGYYVSYPFLHPSLQRVRGSIVDCYAGSFLDDYKGLYFIGWGQARGGVGSLMSAYAPIFARLLKLQDQIKIPIGLVFRELGQTLPQTHLGDPQKVFLQLKFLNILFKLLTAKAHQIDKQRSNFQNIPLETPPLTQESLIKS